MSVIVYPDGTVVPRKVLPSQPKEVDMERYVVHCKKAKYDVYVGRPGKWGNPIYLRHERDRQLVYDKYWEYLEEHPELKEEAKRELAGKVLGCWCAPRLCHGMVLAQIANE